MALIDIGADCIDRGSALGAEATYVDKNNPANASGIITSVDIWAPAAMTGCMVGIFYTTNGNTLKCRDSVAIGNVLSGAKQTFNELSLSVEVGDYIGIYYASGTVETDTSGYAGIWYKIGQYIDPNDEATYDFGAGYAISVYGTGEEAPVGWTGKISGVTNPAKIMGVDVANIAKVKGVVSA